MTTAAAPSSTQPPARALVQPVGVGAGIGQLSGKTSRLRLARTTAAAKSKIRSSTQMPNMLATGRRLLRASKQRTNRLSWAAEDKNGREAHDRRR